ncbi:MAG: hypothetical protein ACLR94_06775 [Acutalibacteraceae bacterium]
MNIEQVKEEAKKRFGKDITDEQAQAWLDAHPTGKLRDKELENVASGGGYKLKFGVPKELKAILEAKEAEPVIYCTRDSGECAAKDRE